MTNDKGPDTEELLAILRANRDLGPEYDQPTAEQIQQWYAAHNDSSSEIRTDFLGDALDWHERRHLAREQRRIFRETRRSSRPHSVIPAVIALSIPLMALADHYARGMGVLAVLIFDFISVLSLIRHSDR